MFLGYNLRIVLKWLLIFVGVSALTVTVALVACKYERTREDQQRASTKLPCHPPLRTLKAPMPPSKAAIAHPKRHAGTYSWHGLKG
jgi:hypothetical protein